VYAEEGLLTRGAELADYWEEKLHELRELPHVRDVRNLGLIGGIDLEPRPGEAGKRGYELHCACFDKGALVRYTGDIVAMSPPLIISREQIDELVGIVAEGLRELR
jgi:beta-alanine--pyruvate transaminase